MATALQPSTNSELQLYRVLQRANLLQYFDTFITQGGDDVQQLCEAGEDEFLEIMALVGMASKPLHVRRLQKALQEWLANPTAFDLPKKFPTIVMSMAGGGGGVSSIGRPGSTPSPMSSTEASLSPAHSIPSSLTEPQQQTHTARPNGNGIASGTNATLTSSAVLTSNNISTNHNVGSNHVDNNTKSVPANQQSTQSLTGNNSSSSSSSGGGTRQSSSPSVNAVPTLGSDQSPPWALQTRGPTPPEAASASSLGGRRGRVAQCQGQSSVTVLPSEHPSPPDSPHEFKDVIKDGVYNPHDAAYITSVSHPVLMDHQISAIAAAAAILSRDLPPIEPKSLPKKQNSKDITTVMMMTPDDPNRLDAMRKYAAIYGRFDSKRKNHRQMSLHEISVNEAAAQLCNHFPALLTRREELFPLARQVVRDSGYQYSKGHSRLVKSDPGFHEYDCTNGVPRAAEVLVQPKLEPVEHQLSSGAVAVGQTSHLPTFVSAPGTGVVSQEEEAYTELQNELAHITLSLSEMDKEQARIRAALRVLLEANDLEQVRGLTAEMDVLNDRQEVLAKRRQRIVAAMTRYKKGGSKASVAPERVNIAFKQNASKQGNKKSFNNNINNNNNNMKVSNSNIHGAYGFNLTTSSNGGVGLYPAGNAVSSISNLHGSAAVPTALNAQATINGSDTDGAAASNPLNTLYLAAMQNQRDSLFEEGLRIATQYGMSDFAKELIGMKTQSKGLGSDDSGISLGVSAPMPVPPGFLPQQSSSSLSNTTASASSALFTSSISSPATSSSAVTHVSSDNISASSPEYLAPASGCRIHTPPSLSASPSSGSQSGSTQSLSSSSSTASLLFPSSVSVIPPKQVKSTKSGKRPWDNSSPCPSSAKSPKVSSPGDSILVSSSSPSTESTTPPSPSAVQASSTAAPVKSLSTQGQETSQGININGLTTSAGAAATTTPSATPSQQGSTTTTAITTTKSGQVVEIEPRRSSRRKNGEPDYYLINGGEKRFRAASSGSNSGSGAGTGSGSISNFGGVGSSPSSKRGSGSDRRKASTSDPPASISSPSKPYTLEPCNTPNNNNNSNSNNNNNHSNNKGSSRNSRSNEAADNGAIRIGMSEMRFRNPAGEIHKVRMGFQQRIEPSDRDKR